MDARAASWWLIVALVVTPLALPPPSSLTGPSVAVMQAKSVAFVLLGLSFVLWALESWWLRAVLAWTWVSVGVAGMPNWALWGLLGVMAWTLTCHAASVLTPAGWRRVQWAIAGAALGQVGLMGLQTAGIDPLRALSLGYFLTPVGLLGSGGDHPDPSLPVWTEGWFSNPMDASVFLGLSLPALLAIHPVLALLAGIAIVSLKTTAGFALLAMTALWWAARRHWSVGMAAGAWLLASGAAFLSYLDVGGLGAKPMIWRAGWNLLWAHPVTGFGVNALDHGFTLTSHDGRWRWNFLFSDVLQWGVETGVVGPLLALAFVVWLAIRTWRTWPAGAPSVLPVAMALVVSTASIPFRIGPVALLTAISVGRLMAVTTRRIPS